MASAAQHFTSLGHSAPPEVNIADMVLDLVIKSPPAVVEGLITAYEVSAVAASDADWLAKLTMHDALHNIEQCVLNVDLYLAPLNKRGVV